jgi:hypothetical protein
VAVVPLVKPSILEIVIPKDDAADATETTPIISNILSTSSRSDPDWIMKAVAASQYEASLVNQEVEARNGGYWSSCY